MGGLGQGQEPLSKGSGTQDVGFPHQTGIGSQNVELPPLSAPQRRGWGRNLGAPYAKPRGQQTEGLSTPFERGSSGVK